MEPILWEGDLPELRSPTLVCAFAGWNDAASAASTALEAVAASLDPEVTARIDPEEFYDFQVNRPTIRLVEGQTREIDWPANTLLSVRVPTAERDLVLLSGVEPNLRWRTFADSIVSAAEQLGVHMVVSLGALMADVAHTRPVPITGLASDPELVEQLGMSRSSYEGPTGIVGVVHDACRRHGMTSASLWAAVPHYVAAVPNPKAALALLRRLEGLTGIAVEAAELEDASERFTEQVDQAVSANPEIEELVANLEASQEEDYEISQDMPSADDLAQDFQRFLRQRGRDENTSASVAVGERARVVRGAAGDPLAGATHDPPELLDVDVDELARTGALVAARRLLAETSELPHSAAREDPRDGGLGHLEGLGDLGTGDPQPP